VRAACYVNNFRRVRQGMCIYERVPAIAVGFHSIDRQAPRVDRERASIRLILDKLAEEYRIIPFHDRFLDGFPARDISTRSSRRIIIIIARNSALSIVLGCPDAPRRNLNGYYSGGM